MVPFGSFRYLESDSSSQVMPEFFIASEYEKPSTDPALRPITPPRCGPMRLVVWSRTWQARHWLKTFLPASTSCARAAPADSMTTDAAATIRHPEQAASNFLIQRLLLKLLYVE